MGQIKTGHQVVIQTKEVMWLENHRKWPHALDTSFGVTALVLKPNVFIWVINFMYVYIKYVCILNKHFYYIFLFIPVSSFL